MHAPTRILLLAALAACSSGGSAAFDVAADTAIDVAADTAIDVAADAVPDAAIDGSGDLPPADGGPDVPAEADAPDLSGVPILERPVRPAFACSKGHDAVALADTWAFWMGADVAALGDQVRLVHGEGAGEQSLLVQSTLALDGTLGAPSTLATLSGWAYVRPRVAARDDRVGVVYVASESPSRLGFLSFDAAGRVLDGPAVLAGSNGLDGAAVLATAGGFAVLGVSSQGASVRFLRLDVHGAALGTPTDLPATGWAVNWPGPSLAAVDGGFVAGWSESGADSSRAALARLDDGGLQQGAVVRLAPGEGAEGTRGPAVVPVSGGLLVGWTETHTPDDWNTPGWSVVRVQRFGADLQPEGPAARVQDPVDGLACHTPVWLDLGPDTPGLSFDCGVLYTICAGCVPTETLGVFALHAADLVPASARVVLKSPTGGGLLNPRYVRQGADWYVYADLTFHALSQPSLSALRCEPTSPR